MVILYYHIPLEIIYQMILELDQYPTTLKNLMKRKSKLQKHINFVIIKDQNLWIISIRRLGKIMWNKCGMARNEKD